MAQGNILQGQGAGKLGDTVLMVRNGVQVARVYTTAGARSGKAASEAARIQRVSFGSASNQWSLYRYVCTRMYRKGKTSSQSDYNYFVKRNNRLLPYLSKEQIAAGVHCLMPGQYSAGDLGRIDMALRYTSVKSESSACFVAMDSQVSGLSLAQWTSKMSVLKSVLKIAYPNATKVTYLISTAAQILVGDTEEEFTSEAVRHIAVIIDLYRESAAGENEQTVAAYFAARLAGLDIAPYVAAATGNFCVGSSLFVAHAADDDELDAWHNLSVLIFALDDNASDCYTTTLPEDAVTPTIGAYVPYFRYRLGEALRIACESYGYQSGVMRDEIAGFGRDQAQQVQAYAARMRSLGVEIDGAEE